MSSREWSRYLHDEVGLAESPRGDQRPRRRAHGRPLPRRPAAAPGAVEAVERLADRWPLGLASSSNRAADRPGARAVGMLRSFGPRSRPRRSRAASPPRTSTSRPRAGWACCRTSRRGRGLRAGIRSRSAAGMRVVAVRTARSRRPRMLSDWPTSCSTRSRTWVRPRSSPSASCSASASASACTRRAWHPSAS